MSKVGRVSMFAVAFVVLLRVAIGWQLFYEGIWKVKTLKSPTPWTAAGYLKNAQGPMRNTFRKMVGDPDDLSWLDAEQVIARWDDWKQRFAQHYKLDNNQVRRLNQLLDGNSVIVAQLDAGLPEKVDLAAVKTKVGSETVQVVTYDPEKKQLKVRGDIRFEPREKEAILAPIYARPENVQAYIDAIEKLYEDSRKIYRNGRPEEFRVRLPNGVPDGIDLNAITTEGEEGPIPIVTYDAERGELVMPGDVEMTIQDKQALTEPVTKLTPQEEAFVQAVDILFKRSARLGYKQRVRALLLGNADNVGVPKQQKVGEIERYKLMLKEYEEKLAQAKQDYEYEHLQKLWKDIQSQRAALVGPVKALDAELKKEAKELLTITQLKNGPVPEPWTSLRITDTLTMAGLVGLGFLLIVGLFTRFAAIMAAIMLFSFYMAMPPLPGLPEAPGPEHSLIVNKNLIEVIALLALATLPSGVWFGLDGLLIWVRSKFNKEK